MLFLFVKNFEMNLGRKNVEIKAFFSVDISEKRCYYIPKLS